MDNVLRIDQFDRTMPRRLAAIAFLDVAGYSRLVGANEETTLRQWSALRRRVIEPRVATWRGRVVDRAGDGLFIEFSSALDAFRWAVDVQEAIARVRAGTPIQVRIALHLGDVIDGPDGEVQGDGVNTAARLQAHADAGGIVVSKAIADEVAGKAGAVFSDLGNLRLKNITRPVHAYKLAGMSTSPPATPFWRRWKWVAGAGAAAAAIITAAVIAIPGFPAHSSLALTSGSPRVAAEALLRQGIAIRCEHPCPREWLAKRALFEQAIALDPDFARPYAEAAFTYTNFVASELTLNKAEDLRAAERLATRAAALAPDQPFAHEARAAVLRQNPDRLEHALSAYLRALALNPKQASVRANAGWMLVLLGRPAEAEPFLKAALEAAPKHSRAPAWMTYLGLAELFQAREGHGADWFRLALEQQAQGGAAADVALQRSLYLAAALALNGLVHEARQLTDELRGQHPALSTQTLWNCDCSRAPGFVAGQGLLRRGVVLAGLRDMH